MSAFCYNLRHDIANWEFYNWLVLVAAQGATSICFDIRNPKTTKWKLPVVLERFQNIIEPGPALLGLPCQLGNLGSRFSCSIHILTDWVKSGKTFPRLRSIKAPGTCKYTVTIREQRKDKSRNSNRPEWLKFADAIGARVIDEYENEPIDLHERFSLYAGAEMNFGMANGPIHAITLSTYPAMMFCGGAELSMSRVGIQQGERFPWLLSNHFMIWKTDTYDNLMQSFSEWREKQC